MKGDAEAQKKQASVTLDTAKAATDALEKRRQDDISQLEETISAGKQELATAIAAQERLKQNISELEQNSKASQSQLEETLNAKIKQLRTDGENMSAEADALKIDLD